MIQLLDCFYQLRRSALLEFHPPIWCEHKYWNSCLTGLSKWSAVSCALILQILKVGNVSYQLYPLLLYSESCIRWWHTQTRMKTRDLTLREKQAIWMLKEKRKSIRQTKQWVWRNQEFGNHQQPTITWLAKKSTAVDDRQIIKAVKMNPKRHVFKITNNFQKAGVMLWQSTVLGRLGHRITDATARHKPLTSTKNKKARLEFSKKKAQSWARRVLELCLWTNETKMNLYLSDGKAKMWRKKGNCKWCKVV